MNMQAKQRIHNQPDRMHVMYASMKSTRNKSVMSSQRKRHACFCHVFPVGHSTFKSLLLFGFLLIAFNYCVNDTVAFNLENRLPIVKYGDADTYFGYSVAGHEIGDDEDDLPTVKWILVGAPLGKNLQPKTNRSGALFKCPITQNPNDCSQVITDGRRYSDDEELSPPLFNQEIKDGQWMGVTVRSQGLSGKVLVCAHRYIAKTGESQHGQGLCYVLTNDLKFDDSYEPCKGRNTEREHEEYGYCQVGTSGALLDDGTMILGTPGPYTWRGTMFVISVGGEYLKRDKNHYYSPHLDQTSPVDKYSYLGMAVTGGQYYGDYLSYAAGAPRSNDNGQVVIFSKSYPLSNNIDVIMKVSQIFDGEQFGSSFGYEIITADINGDDLDDLIVAAPFYFSKIDGGAVYVYQNENHRLPSNYTTKLTGKLESQFGLAMTNIGDINQDGCDDIAIGAPYEGSGVVYIYLGSKDGLTTKPSQVISPSVLGLTSIKTFGSSLSGKIDFDDNTYPDLLIGAYQSAAAVILLSRPITNIRTYVDESEIKNIDPTKQGCARDQSTNLTCFTIEACCSISPYRSSGKTLRLLYTIEAETFNNKKKFSRVFFAPDMKSRSNIVKRIIDVQINNQEHCQTETIYIKENTRDIQSPIHFRLNYTIVESTPSTLKVLNPILDQTQADRSFQASFQKDCGSDDLCQSQLEVYAELELDKEDGEYNLILGKSDELHLNVTVTNEQESAYEAQLFIEHQKSVTYIAASKGQVICNRFNETIVACTLGNPFRRNALTNVILRFDPSALDDSEPRLSFKVFANSTSKQQISRENTVLLVNVVKKAELSIQGWQLPEQSFYGGDVRGESAMDYVEDIGTAVQHTYQIYNDGPWRVPYLNVKIKWPHQVANDKDKGKWLLYLVDKIVIEGVTGECSADGINPLNLPKRPNLLDLAGEPAELMDYRSYIAKMNKSQAVFAMSSEKRAQKSKQSSNTILNRVRRDHAVIIRAERLVDKDGKKQNIVTMDCEKYSAKCITLKCALYNMPSKSEAYVHVKARLWNSTLVNDYPRVDLVKIVSSAHISIPEIYNIKQKNKDDRTLVSTYAYPDLHEQPGDGSIPIWIIIVSIVGGLLLLALFTYCLWRLGFFKRRRPDPTLSGNLEKNSESKLLLNRNR
ncbi:integrin alpha-PS1 isoform X2 [Sitodiplosis mosellana]|uniref:integrin alpha-PS1 isoform X2 n=1 Tax=Sitodiplosis mosellana TaxID=263140 RepID=UPI002443A028|nr:integrin alpha-PS1 isoform X2 [Sitodiplosis mosellana]XP_055302351.1 integrin alpha-PS1 isoform X2 [Sitodiplosis mosellana]XP_055302352.1 integrin alpha-PS1 isoform X2 [Sitodiplosis mosellana]